MEQPVKEVIAKLEQRVYTNGLPFSSPLDKVIKKLWDRVENKKAALILIEGGLGEGKTTLLIHILDYINKINGLPPVDLEGSQYSMGGVDFLKHIRVCYDTKLPCVGYDEAGDFSRRGSLTNFNSMMNRTFETFRAFKCIVVMALPAFWVLDNELIDKNIPRLTLTLNKRTNKSGNYAARSLYRLQMLKFRMAKTNSKSYAYGSVHPNFRGHFLDLAPDRSKQLDKLTTRNKLEILRKSEVRIEGLLTTAELATKLFKSIAWVYKAVRDLKLKPNRRIGSVRYFDVNALNQLVEHSEIVGDARGSYERKPKEVLK